MKPKLPQANRSAGGAKVVGLAVAALLLMGAATWFWNDYQQNSYLQSFTNYILNPSKTVEIIACLKNEVITRETQEMCASSGGAPVNPSLSGFLHWEQSILASWSDDKHEFPGTLLFRESEDGGSLDIVLVGERGSECRGSYKRTKGYQGKPTRRNATFEVTCDNGSRLGGEIWFNEYGSITDGGGIDLDGRSLGFRAEDSAKSRLISVAPN